MRILVNFLPVSRGGGGLQNVRNLWTAIGRHGIDDSWLCVARPEQGLGGIDTGAGHHVDLEEWTVGGFAQRITTENVRLPRAAHEWNADVVLTPMGTGPLRAACPTVIGWHDSTVAYPESALWKQAPVRQRAFESARQVYARAAGRRATAICVQTRTMASRLARTWGVPESRFRIIPNGPSSFLSGAGPASPDLPAGTREILVLGVPKPSKNFEIVPDVADRLGAMGVEDVRVRATFARGDAFSEPFTDAMDRRTDERVPIDLIGRVPHDRLADLYRRSAVVLLPSLLESFSATYVESMHFGVPLVTSDLDFARDICEGAALYADPLDGEALARAVASVLDEPGVRERLREAGFERVRAFPDWAARFRMYRDACAEACGHTARAA